MANPELGQEWKSSLPDFSAASEKDLLNSRSLGETELHCLVPEQTELEFPFTRGNYVGIAS